jgi:hypothetical protein
LIRQRFDSLAKIERCHKPVFLAHGTATASCRSRRAKCCSAYNEPKELFRMEGLDHNHTPRPEFYLCLRDFLSRNEPR